MSTRHLTLPLAALAAASLAACTGTPQDEAGAAAPAVARSTTQPLFVNGGFETGSFAPDWVVSTNINNGLPNPPWPPATVANLNLAAGGTNLTAIVTDPAPESQPPAGLTAGPGVPLWPKFGTATAVVNQQGQNRNVNSIKQTYTTTSADVDPADGKIHVRWVLAPILQNPNHTEQQQPYFFVVLRNTTAPRAGDLFDSFNFSNSPGTPWKAQGNVLYTDWTIFDVAPGNVKLQVGDTLELEVYAAGCSLGGHWGEVYVDGFGAFFPGLSVSKSAPSEVNVDSDITYSFLVKNNTTGAVPNVIADEVLPADTTFVSLSAPTGAVCTTPPVGGTGTVECDFGWMNPGASTTFQVTVHAFTPAAKGPATAGTTTTLTDSARTWTANQWRGYTLAITGGAGAGQQRVVASNTGTQLSVSSAFAPAPDATSTYALVDPPAAVGTATSASGNTLTDNTKSWTTNEFTGWTVVLVGGTGAGQERRIVSNTGNRLTVTPNWTTTPNTSTAYVVKRPELKVVNGDYGVRGSTYARLLGPRVETAMTAGIPYTDLAITKTDGVPAVAWGGALTYTITATNNGPLAVTNATVTDALPALLAAGASWTCVGSNGGTCNTASGTGNINHGVNLPVGGRATFTLTANVIAGTGTSSLVNAAQVTPPSGITDNFPANDEDVDVDGVGPLVALTVNKGPGAGQGSVTSSPAAVTCGDGCASASADFLTGAVVTLTAVARTGDTFAGWSGGGCTGTAVSCTVTLAAATTVTANFTGMSVTGSAPAGHGTVTCVPSDVAQGGTSTCTLAPDTGYGIANVTDNGTDVTSAVVGSAYTLTNVTADHTVVVTFGPLALTPTITSPANGTSTNDPRPTVTGTTSPNVTVTVLVDGVPVCTTTSSGTGAFSCTPPADLSNGPHVITATATNSNGTTPPSSPVNITVDTVAPAAPVVSTPATGSRTNDNTPTYSGTAEASSTVTVRVDGVVVGTTTANASGAWTFTPVTPLADGSHSVNVTATDAASNVSPVSNTNTFTVDTVAPAAPVVSAPANGSRTNDTTPTYSGTAEPGSTVTVRVDGSVIGTATANGSGAWTFTPTTPLADGAHSVNVTATDTAGNVSAASNTNSFTVDTLPPGAPVVSTPANGSRTNDTTPTYSGTAEAGSTVTVRVDGSIVGTTTANGSGAWTFTPVTPLAEGSHSVNATATDAAGNTSATSNTNTFTVDTTAPAAPVVTAPANGSRTNDTTPTYSGTAEAGSTVTIRVDGSVVGTATANASGAWTFTPTTPLAEGSHTVNATATDAAGNTSGASNTNTFTVDVTAPAAPAVTAPANGSTTNDNTPTYAGTAEAGSTVTIRVDGSVIGTSTANASGAWTFTPTTPLADGAHSVNVTATDAAGNTSAASNTNSFTVDTAAPSAPVVTAPANGSSTNDTTPTVTGTAEPNATVTVTLDGSVAGTVTADASGAWTYTPTTPLADGSHSVSVTATDAGGNVSPASNTNTFTVDTAAPSAPVVTAPADGSHTNDSTPAITGTAEANALVTVRIDGSVAGTATANASGAWTFTPTTPLADGSHSVNATATDAAGNVSAASNTNTFTVDTVAPAAPVITSPANGDSTSTTPAIAGTAEANSTVTVLGDGVAIGTATADGTGHWTLTPSTPLTGGAHTLTATSTDSAGNTSTPSAPVSITVLTTGPSTPVLTAPADGSLTSDSTPTYTGTGTPGSTVTVTVDGAPVCTAVVDAQGDFTCTPTTPLDDGPHVVTLEATNAAGTSPVSPPSHFTVDTTPPLTPVVVGPANGSRTSDTTPTVTGTGEPGSTITVRIDGADAGTTTVRPDGTWSFDVPTALALGAHTVSATAVDAAGNASLPSNTNAFTIDDAANAPVVTTPADNSVVDSTTPALAGTAMPGAHVSVLVDGFVVCLATADTMGAFTCTPATPLAEGVHAVTAVTSDGMGGQLTSNTNTFTIDTTAPIAPVVLAPADGSTTADTTPTVAGTAEPLSTVTVFIDGMAAGTTTADASGAFAFDVPTALASGMHTVSATSEDRAGNTSPSSNTNGFTIGATTGPVVMTPADGSRTRDTTPTLSGTATAGATIEARVDGQVVCTATASTSGAWACTPMTALTEGPHAATATEQGSTAASNTNAFVVDSMAPAAPVIVTPADGATTTATPTLSGTAEPGARVTVTVDGADVCVTLADAQGHWSCVPGTPLANGQHSVTATATDAAGNVSPQATPHAFTVGASTPPAAPVLVTPADGEKVSSTTPTLSGTAEPGALVTVSVDGQPVCSARTDATGHFSCAPVSPLSPGQHRASAVARNDAGASAASNVNTFIVPGGEPAAPTITSPAQGAVTNDATPTITGTAEPGSTVTVREGTTVLCTATADAMGAWSCDASTLPDGAHGITATASNTGGEGPASAQRDFTVDTTGPTTTITKGPDASTRDTTGTFEFEASEAGSTFECSLDGAAFTACSSPAALSGLSSGPHVLEVRATDAAGNVGPAARFEWTVTARPVGEFSGGCSCATVEPSAVLAALGLLLAVRRRRR